MLIVWNAQNSVKQQHIFLRNFFLVLFKMSPAEIIVLGSSESVTAVFLLVCHVAALNKYSNSQRVGQPVH